MGYASDSRRNFLHDHAANRHIDLQIAMPTVRARLVRSLLRTVVRPIFLRGDVHDWRRRWPSSWRPAGVQLEPVESGTKRLEFFMREVAPNVVAELQQAVTT